MELLKYSMFLIPFFGWYVLKSGIQGLKVYYRYKKVYIRVDAQIVDFQRVSSDEGADTYAPVFKYVISDKTYTNTSTTSSGRKPEINRDIKIMIDPANPEETYIDSKFRTFAYFFVPVVGLIMLINGIAISYLLLKELF